MLAWLVLVSCGAAGCQPTPIADPPAEALSPDATTSRRIRAVRATTDSDAARLMPLVTSSRHPFDVRRAAVERMLLADADAFWHTASTNIRRVDDWPMITLLTERAAKDGAAAFVPGLIESWGRPSIRYDDTARPERIALDTLAPVRGHRAVLWDAAAGPYDTAAEQRVAIAAWTVLCRLEDRPTLVHGVRDLRTPNALMGGLDLVAQAVDQLPRDREELLWLRAVVANSTPANWEQRDAACSTRSTDPGPATLAIRHLPTIDRATDAQLETTRRGRMQALSARLATARRVSRGSDSEHANIRVTPDTLADHADALGWADLLVVEVLLDALADRALVADLFAQAERDRADTSTEHGGVLVWGDAGRVTAMAFDPLMRRHDEEYIASDGCIEAMYDGLAHYHFHAQRHDNADWAGPGGGDFAFANNLHANCVVFTYVDARTLNADAYFPGGVVVDLGCLTR